eukprot:355791-Chlamydomonas_euryale.AAC.6
MANNIQYSEKYYDDVFEYRCAIARTAPSTRPAFRGLADGRDQAPAHFANAPCLAPPAPPVLASPRRHVVLPPEIAALMPKGRLLSEVNETSRREGCSADASAEHEATMHICKCLRPVQVIQGNGRVARHWRAAVARLGALRHSPPRAAHHALSVRHDWRGGQLHLQHGDRLGLTDDSPVVKEETRRLAHAYACALPAGVRRTTVSRRLSQPQLEQRCSCSPELCFYVLPQACEAPYPNLGRRRAMQGL